MLALLLGASLLLSLGLGQRLFLIRSEAVDHHYQSEEDDRVAHQVQTEIDEAVDRNAGDSEYCAESHRANESSVGPQVFRACANTLTANQTPIANPIKPPLESNSR